MVVGCADAGKDQRVKSNAEVVLDASASKPDFQGKIVSYKWKQIRGKRVELSDLNNVRTTFIAPSVTKRTKLLFKLTTVEKGGYRSPWKTTDTVAVIITPDTSTHILPVAKAEVNASSIKYGQSVHLSAV